MLNQVNSVILHPAWKTVEGATGLFLKLKTFWRLGLVNIARVTLYRLGLRTGLHPALRLKHSVGGTKFFAWPERVDSSLPCSMAWDDEGLYFDWYTVHLKGKAPAWNANPFTGLEVVRSAELPWWQIPDFSLNVGDIKTVWEASRFNWVLALAQRVRAGDEKAFTRLNAWLADWCRANPAYYGPNWKCGQEASIRVMHLAMAAKILYQPEMCPDLIRLVEAHLLRIDPTLSYALAQDNNHGTSEAAALFIGGSWCAAHGIPKGQRWAQKGRRLMENRVKRLIAPDGSFSQYSTNYHRVLIDTLCMVEIWRRWIGLDEFSPLFYQRAKAATHWLFALVEPNKGDAPNLGGNDGARLLPIANTGFRDFRPSVQLAMALFGNQSAYVSDGSFNIPLKWLGIPLPRANAKNLESQQFGDGGYSVLRHDQWMAVLKYPRYRFRPRHCDALHVDLWIGSDNLLRDGGSYSYNAEARWQDYFIGTAAHNTIEFDDRDQMPRLGRFLHGAWLAGRDVEFGEDADHGFFAAAGYFDWKGAFHHRKIKLQANVLVIWDNIRGFVNRAVLRWRLQPGDWQLERKTAVCDGYHLRVRADVPIVRCELVQGWESRHYFQKTLLPVLEIEVQTPGEIITEFFV